MPAGVTVAQTVGLRNRDSERHNLDSVKKNLWWWCQLDFCWRSCRTLTHKCAGVGRAAPEHGQVTKSLGVNQSTSISRKAARSTAHH